ncbi:MAG TPA: T9SS type A sorting domain-containing protein, partial [Puia sp.]
LRIGNTSQAYTIRVLNLDGQTIRLYQTTPGATSVPMDLSGLAKGVYTIKVVSPTSVATQKLLVQ